jgi:hypothetical protein
MTIKVEYFDGIKKEFNSLDDIIDYNEVKILNCNRNKLITLPKLPKCLIELHCNDNKLTNLPKLPNNITELDCRWNKLIELPELPNSLKGLFCYNNQLTKLPELPNSLTELFCGNNKLSELPNSFINCIYLQYFNYQNNPIELTIQQINFINWIQNRKLNNSNYYNDGQNVHNNSVQKSLVNSINNLLKN